MIDAKLAQHLIANHDAKRSREFADKHQTALKDRHDALLAHMLQLVESRSRRGHGQIICPLKIINPPVTPEQRTKIHDALRAKGFTVEDLKHKETAIKW